MFEGQDKIRKEEYPQLLNRVWLNSAAFAPHAKSVVKAMEQFIHYFHDPTVGKAVDQLFQDVTENTMSGAAKLWDCNKENVSLVINTAHGLNYPLHGIEWQKGDNLVTSELEFPTNYLPWKYISKRKGIEFRAAKINEQKQISEEEIISLIDDKTKLVSLSLVQFNNGQRVDAKRIAKVAHEHGALVSLDAIQACGAIEVYPEKMDVDFVSAGGPKFLMAPLGIGLCYISSRVIETMEPPLQGTSNYDFSDGDWMSREKPYHKGAKRFQNGTVPFYCVAGLNAALNLINSVGIKTVANHNHSLIKMLIEGVEEMGLKVITPHEFERRGALANVRVDKDKDLNKIVELMEDKYRVTISTRFDGLRFSVQLFNTEVDIQKGLLALKTTLKEV
ncbi:MAG TPA: aminotransferase class V-fold PLP-dependent enzyme [candidate division Zixibacteria bacterium]|nr:aminotransferase class V-fold PLP-dependent enzyme [candidate division Zixibacteria bacterium]